MEKIMFAWWNLQRALKSEKGQGMVEYGLILAVVAVVAIVSVKVVGTNLNTMFNTIAGSIK